LKCYAYPLGLWTLTLVLTLIVFPVDPTISSIARDAHLSKSFPAAARPKLSAYDAWTLVSDREPKPLMIWFIKDGKYFFPTRQMKHMDSFGHYGYRDVGWSIDPYTGDLRHVEPFPLIWLPVDFGNRLVSP
jgi:hypothetical protein